MTSKEIIPQMTLEEKAALCSGRDFWSLKGIERFGLEAIMVTDGPHGLRKQGGDGDHLGLNQSVPATCFPAACATACSFDRSLLEEIGAAMGEECRKEKVAVLLGPAANIKRSPLCGRNFEYISEDPFLTGEIAAALIKGVQKLGVGTSLKHYAVNNQEKRRMTINAVVDERAFREIYLAGFEKAVREAKPWTLMCSYNKINGTYASENKKLLTDILRDEWAYQGLVMTDWGASNNRLEGIKAGLDLQMPGPDADNDKRIIEAVKSGALSIEDLDKVVARVVDLIIKAGEGDSIGFACDMEAHHLLARRAAAESAVLLKNDENILPLVPGKTLAVIGAFAISPRYQGAGSSKINPSHLDKAFDAIMRTGIKAEYAPGYSLEAGSGVNEKLIAEAAKLAGEKDSAVVFAGLPDEYESEGFDRASMDMSESHNKLIEAVAKANPNTVVVLQLGSPVALPWADKVKGILLLYLSGQAGGGAAADLLTGNACPGGKLAETWPLALEDNPSYGNFPGSTKTVEYRESIFAGYRWYDALEKEVRYPFGFGLSYTSFEYSDLKLGTSAEAKDNFKKGDALKVSFTVKNTGSREGSETAQLYIAPDASVLFRAKKELKGFEKLHLKPGESKTVTLILDERSFAYYNVQAKDWSLEGGLYRILIGASSRDIRLEGKLELTGDKRETAFAFLKGGRPVFDDASFKAIYGAELPPKERLPGEPFTVNTSVEEIKDTPIGKALFGMAVQGLEQAFGKEKSDLKVMMESMLMDMPLRGLGMMSGGRLTPPVIEALVEALNGKPNPIASGLLGMK
ncbi:glycoside hydrolase family 3 C-terminal domain-containing protein [Leadbettera azotonutricia]|uniref:Beta-glucosidase (Gentiobiase) (Cellobiase) (Beta-D-glucoside glucohydrolase) n=1 Tax=Leadbettera azotonutricia (strain ATCC BAA-888 / DSM 13862 / ZAS-9) TaxID=545695 RepID=F5YGD5_LEAAZ|nr:glycoside hydrolase family 3 C-terminal domain-containing protein [Leadbettera azotonutricia]AEF82048.1 beta-glucosidase (Gentiobiase) (Cellobiase) (Beta-D-glucoside glucohydrolase) [Leadbettera azotonutricia ZAS-9]